VVIERRIESSTRAVDELRAAFLEKRVERRQAETLVEEAEARDAIESGRRTQQSLDNWYLTRVPEEKSRK
jgi:flagellar biosynthesis chaperone FliJ